MNDLLEMHQRKAVANFKELQSLMSMTMDVGYSVEPRGMLIKECLDSQLIMHPLYPFQTFEARKYDIEYFKTEMRWKLGANKYDESIKAHAKMWESVQNPDGTFNSNYGQFWFGEQNGLWNAVCELIRDPHSRRASIPMLAANHLAPHVKDTVCTEAVTFHIRNNELHTTVHMRSSDQIFGLGTDIPTFSVLTNLALGLLRSYFPNLQMGLLRITAASSHIYERHFGMVEKIRRENFDRSKHMHALPEITDASEAMAIIGHRGEVPSPTAHVPAHWYLYRFIYGSPRN